MGSIDELDLRRPVIYVYRRRDGTHGATLVREIAEQSGDIVERRKLFDKQAVQYVQRWGTVFPDAYDTVRELADMVDQTDGLWKESQLSMYEDAKELVLGEVIRQPFWRRLKMCLRLFFKKV